MKLELDPILILGIVKQSAEALRGNHPALAIELNSAHAHLTRIADHIQGLSHPITEDFLEGLEREQQFQRLNWGLDKDETKSDDDWFWLIAFLATKAKQTPDGDPTKKRHRLISTAAALMNWHAQTLDDDEVPVCGAQTFVTGPPVRICPLPFGHKGECE